MTIFDTAYDTSACSGFRIKDIQDKLAEGRHTGALRKVTVRTNHNQEGATLFLLEGGNSSADVIPYFHHPMRMPAVKVGGREEDVEIALDVRPFGKWYAPNSTFVVRNRTEYEWNVKRAILNYVWLTERKEILRDISPIPAQVYASLMSDAISRRFALDNGERVRLQVLAAFFYLGLFGTQTDDELARDKMVATIGRIVPVGSEAIYDWVGSLEPIRDLTGFCKAAQDITGSVALQDFNLRTLVAIIGGTWFGTNARENIVVALEHVPTWVMAVAASLDEATFKRSALAKVSERFGRGNAASNFIKSLNTLIGADVMNQLERSVSMEGFNDVIKSALITAKLALTTNSKQHHALKADKQGRLEFDKKPGEHLYTAIGMALHRTYNNPDWVKKNVPSRAEPVQHGLMGHLYAGKKPVAPDQLAGEFNKLFEVLWAVQSKEDPFNLVRWQVYDKACAAAKHLKGEELLAEVAKAYDEKKSKLESPISDRIDGSKAKMQAIGCMGDLFNGDGKQHEYTYNGYHANADVKPAYAPVTQENYQLYVDAIKELGKLSVRLDSLFAIAGKKINLPYFEDLPKAFWEQPLEGSDYFDLYVENVTTSQSREEMSDFFSSYSYALLNAIKAVYYLLFNA